MMSHKWGYLFLAWLPSLTGMLLLGSGIGQLHAEDMETARPSYPTKPAYPLAPHTRKAFEQVVIRVELNLGGKSEPSSTVQLAAHGGKLHRCRLAWGADTGKNENVEIFGGDAAILRYDVVGSCGKVTFSYKVENHPDLFVARARIPPLARNLPETGRSKADEMVGVPERCLNADTGGRPTACFFVRFVGQRDDQFTHGNVYDRLVVSAIDASENTIRTTTVIKLFKRLERCAAASDRQTASLFPYAKGDAATLRFRYGRGKPTVSLVNRTDMFVISEPTDADPSCPYAYTLVFNGLSTSPFNGQAGGPVCVPQDQPWDVFVEARDSKEPDRLLRDTISVTFKLPDYRCFGALGNQCDAPGLCSPISNSSDKLCAINQGSWRHDECCLRYPRFESDPSGFACGEFTDTSHCFAEFTEGTTWLKHSWLREVKPEVTNTACVSHGDYCAPKDSIVADSYFCCSQEAADIQCPSIDVACLDWTWFGPQRKRCK